MNFWERRKAAVAAEAQADEAARAREADVLQQAADENKSDAELLEELGLPEPETLGADDDFKVFMAEGVPQRLKTRALRCLWRTNPVLANVDGLVDYGEDFTDAACVVENLQTAYQVGKGMLAHVEEMARQAEARENPVSVPAADIGADEAETVALADADAASADTPPENDASATSLRDDPPVLSETSPWEPDTGMSGEDVTDLPPRRRMTFTFDDAPA